MNTPNLGNPYTALLFLDKIGFTEEVIIDDFTLAEVCDIAKELYQLHYASAAQEIV